MNTLSKIVTILTLVALILAMAVNPAYADRSVVRIRKNGPLTQKHRNAISEIEHIMRRSGDSQKRPTKFSYSCNQGNEKIRQIVATFPADEQFILSDEWDGECFFYIPPTRKVNKAPVMVAKK
ncbi:MAG: hypothetical protein HYT15_05110 [Candidatus Magasanikbacteria bacterium]|nr:hypothetical protein [Candidatus Magasanikbacteria bacterium]